MADNQMHTKERKRRSKLEPYAHLIGKLSDREVATMAGITPDGVRMYRQRHDIPPARSRRRQNHQGPSTSGLGGFLVTVSDDNGTKEWVLLAADLAEAAEKAANTLGDRADSIKSIRFLAQAL